MRLAHRVLAVTGAVAVCGASVVAASAAGAAPGAPRATGGAPASTVLGQGPHRLVVRISQDAYEGDARYTISVDGQQQGGELTAAAAHGSGASDRVLVRGSWTGAHQVSVRFLNDAYDGDSSRDRNLYVDSARYDGRVVPGAARALYGQDDEAAFTFGAGPAGGRTPSPTSSTTPSPSEPAPTTPAPTTPDPTTPEPTTPDPTTPAPTTPDPTTPEPTASTPAPGGFHESFDDGVGALAHTWGDTSKIDTSVRGQITLTGTSGAMEWPSGKDAGHGYGTFSFEAKLTGDKPGPALVLWPADDKWPGQEFDLGEITADGVPYLTTHWDDGGSDGYSAHTVPGLDESQWHTWAVRWEPGRLTYTVDGQVVGTDTEHVPADAAHGGLDDVLGVMNRPGDDTSLTVRDAAWTPLG